MAERAVILGYVPPRLRPAFAALLALDERLGSIVRTTREPIVGQMRLTWWFEALEALDAAAPAGEPVLAALVADVLPHGVTGRWLSDMIDGWEALLSPDPLDPEAIRLFARARGGTMFAALAHVLAGAGDAAVIQAGEGWALADLALHLREPMQAALARRMAAESLERGFGRRWPPALRPIGMLALLARDDVLADSPRPGAPRRLARLLMHRIWGR